MSEELKALEALAAKQRTQRGNMMMLGNADPEIVDAIRVIRATDAENQRLRAEVEALREALAAVIESRDANCSDREEFKQGGPYGDYWSPSNSMVHSSAIAKARAALKQWKEGSDGL